MKKSMKVVALVMVTAFLLTACTKQAKESKIVVTDKLDHMPTLVGANVPNFPLSTDGVTLNILSTQYDDIDPNDVFVWQQYREMSGVTVNFTGVNRDERTEAVYNALLNNQPYDLFMRCKLSSRLLTQYGEAGMILDLTDDDLLATYAPNCWAYLQSHPEALASVMNPDGSIYSIPQINSGAELRVALKLFVNKNWLENVGMELPTTTKELYTLLVAFKEQDANGNGDTTDEIPLCTQDWSSCWYSLAGAFGLMNRGYHNTTIDFDEATGSARIFAASDSYRDMLSYFHTLYTEGLLDSNVFSISNDMWKNNIENDVIGIFASTNLAWVPEAQQNDWIAIDEALEGPNGDKLWSPIRADFHSAGAAVIPASCKDPALVLQWLDYFWTDEGSLFYHMGIEGETFVANDNGTFDYTEDIYNEMSTNNLSFDDVIAQYSPYPGGSNPTVEIAPYFMGGEMAEIPAAAARSLIQYGPTEYWPSFTFDVASNERLDMLKTDFDKYIDTMQIEFITGTTSFDNWDEYLAQLDALHMDEILSLYEVAIERYEAMKVE
ncbi:MAG TPA: extracellular solute-binding protein [Bacillota bacterium]|nr:extracellular solute-binding protein [Bacillota bacterium]HPE38684.1 extracellular solute-binding protein [Bacillota bacterium]